METELSTAKTDGSRKWIFPIPAFGRWHFRRQWTAYGLIAWLLSAPWIQIGGHQAVFFDLIHRKIHFLGLTFWVNEMIIFLLFTLFLLVSIVLLTVVLGRVFCGWACPITVFMEFVFRPIERYFEGFGSKQKEFKNRAFSNRVLSQSLKWALFTLVAVILGNTFVAYIMGSHRLIDMVQEGPFNHWAPFVFMLISSAVILFQYGWFREQVCLFVCPYGRLQSVLLDRDSLIVAYDTKRGEPRGKKGTTSGDCIDCKLCVNVCPTGIDIRQGLQMECIHCTQCMDACDSIMTKINRPEGLIRYQTESQVLGQKRSFLRPRLAIYGLVLLVTSSLLVGFTLNRKSFNATIHREASSRMYTIDSDGKIVNPVRIHLTNSLEKETRVKFEAVTPDDLEVISPEGEIHLAPMDKTTVHLLLKLPREEFREDFGLKELKFKAVDSEGSEVLLELRAVGPAN